MTSTPTRDDLLDAYLRGKAAGRVAAEQGLPDDDAAEEPLTYEAVLAEFDRSRPGDLLTLRTHKPAELTRILLEAVEREQFVYRTTHADGWMAQVLSTHGSVIVSQDSKGVVRFNVPSPPLHSGSVDLAASVLKVQQDYRDNPDKGHQLETGHQFGRFLL